MSAARVFEIIIIITIVMESNKSHIIYIIHFYFHLSGFRNVTGVQSSTTTATLYNM